MKYRPVSLPRALAVALLLASTVAGCNGAPRPEPPNVILISIDSLRPANLGCYGYERDTSPFIDSLAAAGLRFENAVSTTSWTLPAHAAMFTGLNDSAHGLVDNGQRLGEGHVTLAEVLKQNGYSTAGFFGGPYLHPTFGLSQGFDTYQSCMTTTPDETDDGAVRDGARSEQSRSHRDITGPRTREEIARWAEAVGDDRYFLFVHLWDVHYDYIPPAEYVEQFDPGYSGPVTGEIDPADGHVHAGIPARDLQHLVARYDGEIRFSDDILRGIFDDLAASGLLDNTLTVVTADHGEEFFEHGETGHQRTLFDEVIRVPLILHWPGVIEGGRTITDQVRLIDLLPTLAEYAGHDGELVLQGRSLAPLIEGRPLPEAPALSELLVDQNQWRALRTNRLKVISMHPRVPTVLVDLQGDPGERYAIGPGGGEFDGERVAWEQRLQQAVNDSIALGRIVAGASPEAIELDPALRERLRSLGYID
jgi:arylsulfatase A-like enzyme